MILHVLENKKQVLEMGKLKTAIFYLIFLQRKKNVKKQIETVMLFCYNTFIYINCFYILYLCEKSKTDK